MSMVNLNIFIYKYITTINRKFRVFSTNKSIASLTNLLNSIIIKLN